VNDVAVEWEGERDYVFFLCCVGTAGSDGVWFGFESCGYV